MGFGMLFRKFTAAPMKARQMAVGGAASGRASEVTRAFRGGSLLSLFTARRFGQSSIQATAEPQTGGTLTKAVRRAWSFPFLKRG